MIADPRLCLRPAGRIHHAGSGRNRRSLLGALHVDFHLSRPTHVFFLLTYQHLLIDEQIDSLNLHSTGPVLTIIANRQPVRWNGLRPRSCMFSQNARVFFGL